MADRRPLPLPALSTLTRRPRVEVRPPAAGPPAPAAPPPAARSLARSSTTPSTPPAGGWPRPTRPPRAAPSVAEGEDRLAWLGLYRPEPHELGELAELFDLPELAVEDAIQAHQRPKFERYGDTLFVVLKAARYRDEVEEVEFGELHLFLGKDFVDHRPAQRVAGPLPGAPAAGEHARAAGQGQRGGALRDPRRRRRRVLAGARGPRERHRRDRDRGLPRRPGRLAAHLRAVPGGARLPAGRPAADRHPRRDHRGLRQVRRRRGAAQLPARRRRPRRVGQRAGGGLPAAAARHPHGQRDAGRAAAERRDPRADRDRRSRRARRSRRSPPGPPSCSRRRWSAPSTA